MYPNICYLLHVNILLFSWSLNRLSNFPRSNYSLKKYHFNQHEDVDSMIMILYQYFLILELVSLESIHPFQHDFALHPHPYSSIILIASTAILFIFFIHLFLLWLWSLQTFRWQMIECRVEFSWRINSWWCSCINIASHDSITLW